MTNGITGVLRHARIEKLGDGEVLIGQVYGDSRGRFMDGEVIHTSHVVSRDGDTFTTRNSVYKVESWADGAEIGHSSFQARVVEWANTCFDNGLVIDKAERNHRFLEEGLELVQALGTTAQEAHMLVDYVYSRPCGEPAQEVGGVMVTLALLCAVNGLDYVSDGERDIVGSPSQRSSRGFRRSRRPSPHRRRCPGVTS